MSSNKLGRNDPCPCGSGKKHKRCCGESFAAFEIADFEWRQLRQLEGAVFDKHLIPYAMEELPDEVVKFALSDCFPEDLPSTLDKELLFNNFFIPWFLFNWIPFDDFGIKRFESKMAIAQNYVKLHETKLNRVEKHFIEIMNQSYYSFYSVLQVEMEKSLMVKDILLGTTHTLKERQGTHQLKRGDVIFSRILTLDKQSIFVGMAPFVVPARYNTNLIDFKEWLIEENNGQALNPEVLRNELDVEILDYFFEMMVSAFNNPFPTLVNTDGDLLLFSKSYFKLTLAPEEALNQLLPLTLSGNIQEFLDSAVRDESGGIQRIEFPWLKKGNKRHKNWDNTVMGHIILEEGKLILETNSEKRTQRGKKLLAKHFGEAVCFQQTVMESPEQALQASPKLPRDKDSKNKYLLELPEVQEQLKALVKSHWENWFDGSIPALDNKTPREAAKTTEGRERLEALLLQYERHNAEKNDNLLKADIPYLRTELGLD